MDRRQFLATSGLAAAAPAMAATQHGAASAPEPTIVNFTSDGLDLDPQEYAALLLDVAGTGKLEADDYSIGGAVAALEREFAERLGKEAAMFVPTGTLANHLAVRVLAGTDRRVIVQAESHLYNDSGDCASTLSGLTLVPLGEGSATLALDDVRRVVERTAGGRVALRVGAISIENPVRRREHAMVDLAELDRVCAYAREQGIRLHLDGARLFNLPFHSGRSVREYAARFDTVYVSLWKHFNGASGAILAGDKSIIDGLFHMRRMFGGALPHAWPQIAPVQRCLATYEDDYARAWRAAERVIAALETAGVAVRRIANGTCRFLVKPARAVPADAVARALERGVRLANPRPDGEIAMQVNASILRRPAEEIAAILVECLKS